MEARVRMTPLIAYSGWEDATLTDIVALTAVEGITAVAFFMAGAMAGSFLNVVLHRLPLRQHLLWPPSSCPRCGYRLAIADNIPVVSWLMLGGQCRRCKAPIAPRYVWIEAGLGVASLALFYLLVHTGGSTLPLRPPNLHGGALYTLWYPRPGILWIYAYFAGMAFFLICLSLFAATDAWLPAGVIVVALTFAVGLPLLGLQVQQVPLTGAEGEVMRGRHLGGPLESIVGLLAGTGLGAALALVTRHRKVSLSTPRPLFPLPAALDLPVMLGLAGAWLGWQAAVSVGVMTALALALGPPYWRAVAVAAVAAVCQLLLWRLLTWAVPWWPGPHTPTAFMAGWAVVAIALGALGRRRGWRSGHALCTPAETPPATSPEPPR